MSPRTEHILRERSPLQLPQCLNPKQTHLQEYSENANTTPRQSLRSPTHTPAEADHRRTIPIRHQNRPIIHITKPPTESCTTSAYKPATSTRSPNTKTPSTEPKPQAKTRHHSNTNNKPPPTLQLHDT
ncbi:hypothetical protein M758_2G141900 [Ceratodon purpureus]|nr:hypothetical protein M758_2G141900 [Ceratodon purpureus]